MLSLGLPLKTAWKLLLDDSAVASAMMGNAHVTPICWELCGLPVGFWAQSRELVALPRLGLFIPVTPCLLWWLPAL